jgi:hypothetical protein
VSRRHTPFVSPVFAPFVLRDVSYPEYGTLSAVYSLVLGSPLPRVGATDPAGDATPQ